MARDYKHRKRGSRSTARAKSQSGFAAGLATGLRPDIRAEDVNAALLERLAVGLGRRVVPHDVVHGRRDRERRLGCETDCCQQVGCAATDDARHDLGCCRGNQDHVGPARKFDMAHRTLGLLVPQV